MDGKVGTRAFLFSLLEDIEIVSKELLEYTGKQSDLEPSNLIHLLANKDASLQHHLAIAKEQEVLQAEVEELELEIEKRDANIRQLQSNLKTAEEILSTILYEAHQKLKSIEQANKKKVSSEELIKYAHKISASNSVNSPPNWMPDDPRRPYPTETEMRSGLLFSSEKQTSESQLSGIGMYPGAASLSWQPSVELQSTVLSRPGEKVDVSKARGTAGNNINMPQHDVELMSSDSSSSSSSDE